jgi:S1-C subfamily serine protease
VVDGSSPSVRGYLRPGPGKSTAVWVVVANGLERGRAAEVGEEAVTVGSGPGCTIALSDPDVAPLHLSLRPAGDADGVELVPIAEQPVLLDGREVTGTSRVQSGSRLSVAGAELELRDRAPADPDPEVPTALAEAIGSDGPRADDELLPLRERRGLRRATVLAGAAAALAVVAGVLALTGVMGGDGDGMDVAAIVREATPSTVQVIARDGMQEASGSGWVLDAEEGLVITNFHVINGGARFGVAVDGAERTARILGAAPCDDLAVLQVSETHGMRALQLAESGSIAQGDPVVAVGYAAGAADDRLTSTTGVVSVPSQPLAAPSPEAPHFRDMLQTDAAINPGNSGGPLLDAERRVVGVNTAVLLERDGVPLQNIGYAIGVDRVRDVAADLREARSQSWLGTGLQFPSRSELRELDLPTGVIASGVVEGTPAARSPLQRRPLLVTAVDGRRLDGTMTGYCAATDGKRSGDSVALDVSSPGGRRNRISLRMG